MKSEIMLPGSKIKAEGRITIEYTDGITGEVKKRFQSENHAFPGGFLRQNNYAFGASDAGQSCPFGIFLSDKGDDVNYDIPMIPGNVIGYGYPGSAASGLMQGAENTAARSLGVYSSDKWHYKRQWSWLPSQVPTEIKSFGISRLNVGRSASNSLRDLWMACTQQPVYNGRGDASTNIHLALYDLGIGYQISGSMYPQGSNGVGGALRRYQLTQDLSLPYEEEILLKDIVPTPSDIQSNASNSYYESSGSGMLAVDVDTNDLILLLLYKDTSSVASVQIVRMDAYATTMKSNTIYKCGTYTKVSTQYPFTGYDGRNSIQTGYYADGKFYTLYGEPSTGLSLVAEIDPAAWSASGDFLDAFSFSETYTDYEGYRPHAQGYTRTSVKGGYPLFCVTYGRLANLSASASSSRLQMVVMNPETNKPYATRYVYLSSQNSYYHGFPFMESFDGKNAVLQHIGYYNNNQADLGNGVDGEYNYYRNLSDYTLYVLPDNAPVREEGQGVTITYEIAWGYST